VPTYTLTATEIRLLRRLHPDTFKTERIVSVEMDRKKDMRTDAIVQYLDYQIPVTQLKGPTENADMQAVKRD